MTPGQHEKPKVKKVIDARLERADMMLQVLKENPIPEDARADFWRFTTLIGERKDDESDVLDALCCLMHKAVKLGLDPASTISATSLHLEKETGRKIDIIGDRAGLASSAAGDRLVIYCLESGRFWSEVHGWISDPLEATTYAADSAEELELPRGRCDVAQISQVRNLINSGGILSEKKPRLRSVGA